ncbi:MAG: hypothetical protein ACTSQY_00690 [Candidatus Odinarchaeia archaeon]
MTKTKSKKIKEKIKQIRIKHLEYLLKKEIYLTSYHLAKGYFNKKHIMILSTNQLRSILNKITDINLDSATYSIIQKELGINIRAMTQTLLNNMQTYDKDYINFVLEYVKNLLSQNPQISLTELQQQTFKNIAMFLKKYCNTTYSQLKKELYPDIYLGNGNTNWDYRKLANFIIETINTDNNISLKEISTLTGINYHQFCRITQLIFRGMPFKTIKQKVLNNELVKI